MQSKSPFLIRACVIISIIFLLSIVAGTIFFYKSDSASAQKSNSRPLMIGISNDISWDNQDLGSTINSDIVAGPWVLGQWREDNSKWFARFKDAENSNKTPFLYSYIVAGQARKNAGLQDCNISETNNLCTGGAQYLRNNSDQITQEYINMAQNIKADFGIEKELFIQMEPDFFQYASGEIQEGGQLTFEESHRYMNIWTDSIKNILPNASLVLDVSPWNYDLAGWSQGFSNFDYAGMVGKRFDPNGDGSIEAGIDGKTYKQMAEETGKELFVNDTHGPGGVFMEYNYNWNDIDLVKARERDGIIGILLPPNDLDATTAFIDEINPPEDSSLSQSSQTSSFSSEVFKQSSLSVSSIKITEEVLIENATESINSSKFSLSQSEELSQNTSSQNETSKTTTEESNQTDLSSSIAIVQVNPTLKNNEESFSTKIQSSLPVSASSQISENPLIRTGGVVYGLGLSALIFVLSFMYVLKDKIKNKFRAVIE